MTQQTILFIMCFVNFGIGIMGITLTLMSNFKDK